MAISGGKDDGSPMMDMNTTPLIDVMLVLLIMFIITIPVATHCLSEARCRGPAWWEAPGMETSSSIPASPRDAGLLGAP